MKLSVIIPAYNEERFLARTLQSLREQDFKDTFETIVVDNNSSDKTKEIARAFGARVVEETNLGPASACDRGFRAAKGEILARTDADTILPPDWLSTICQTFGKNPKLIAIGGPAYPLESSFLENLLYYPIILFWTYLLKLSGKGYFFANMAVRKEAFLACGGFDTSLSYCEDKDICRRLSRIGKTKLVHAMYIFASTRRLRALGLFTYLRGYALGNFFAWWTGKKSFVDLDAIRLLPAKPPSPQKPWVYLIASPLCLLFTVGLLGGYLLKGQPVSAKSGLLEGRLGFLSARRFSPIGKSANFLKHIKEESLRRASFFN